MEFEKLYKKLEATEISDIYQINTDFMFVWGYMITSPLHLKRISIIHKDVITPVEFMMHDNHKQGWYTSAH
jgi:hypothetical protein